MHHKECSLLAYRIIGSPIFDDIARNELEKYGINANNVTILAEVDNVLR